MRLPQRGAGHEQCNHQRAPRRRGGISLHNLLQNAHIAAPHVLVGHLVSGWFVRVYAATYPEDLEGMVLVDGWPPDWLSQEMATLPAKSSGEAEGLTNCRNSETLSFGSTSGTLRERLNLADSAAQAAKLTSLGDMPLVVHSHSPTGGGLYTGIPDDLNAKVERLWQQMQAEGFRLSANGSLVAGTRADFRTWTQEPQLVFHATRKVVEEARKR